MTTKETNHELSCIEAYFSGCLTSAMPGSSAAARFLRWIAALDRARKAVEASEGMEDDGK